MLLESIMPIKIGAITELRNYMALQRSGWWLIYSTLSQEWCLYEQRIYEVERSILGDDFKAEASLKMSWALPKVELLKQMIRETYVLEMIQMVKANRVAIDEKDYYYSNKLISELLSDGFTNHSRLYKRMAMNYKRPCKIDEVLSTIELWEANVGENF